MYGVVAGIASYTVAAIKIINGVIVSIIGKPISAVTVIVLVSQLLLLLLFLCNTCDSYKYQSAAFQ